MKTEITKEFKFEMAHLLEDHNGLCKNVHGHSYRLFVTVSSTITDININKKSRNNIGMVIDFKDLKNIVDKKIINKLDHSFAYNGKDKKSKIIAEFLDKQICQKLHNFNFRVTAENMAKWIYTELNKELVIGNFNCVCTKVQLYETQTSCATYSDGV